MAKAKFSRRNVPKREKRQQAPAGPLPVTLLSGFLGSGKTTLLQHILTRNHGLRIAVVVNDIGAVNVDASLIQKTHKLTKTEEKVIAMQNGCICCTLRGDLLEELVKISKLQRFDYIIIESSGISEPEQVAETFDVRLAEQMNLQAMASDMDADMIKALKQIQNAGGLEKFAKLDTAVTVIDAFTMMNDFETADLLSSRRNDVTEEDERTVSDLMVDQIEFANVIVLNKVDMVNTETKNRLRDVITSLNPSAKIIETSRGKVDAKDIVNTKLFKLDEAKLGSGWLQDLHAMTAREVNGRKVITPKPETEEYNVRNFVYRRHRPFHPDRLYQLLRDKFILQLQHDDEEDEEEDDDDDDDENEEDDEASKEEGDADEDMVIVGSDDVSHGSEMSDVQGDGSSSRNMSDSTVETAPSLTNKAAGSEDGDQDHDIPDNDAILANRRQHPVLKDLLRSKGGFWLATRPNRRGEWSQAGAMLTLSGDLPFFCTMDPSEYQGEDGEVNELLKHDIEMGGEWGDRRQELVFIGLQLQRENLAALLDECLLNDEEWQQWQEIMRSDRDLEAKEDALNELFDDGFPDWPDEDDHDHDGEEDDDHYADGGHHVHPSKKIRSISAYKEKLEEVS